MSLEDTGGGATAEEDVGATTEDGVGFAALLPGGGTASEDPGTTTAELESPGSGGVIGLVSSSEQAENMLITDTQVPTASHFLEFISAFLFIILSFH
jgi:hypothetical protein